MIALAVGILFGFVLERAGFGDSRNLTNIFYFRDMRVLKVMSQPSSAMVGLIILSWIGLFDYSMLLEFFVVSNVFVAPARGNFVRLGFLIGGHCPGHLRGRDSVGETGRARLYVGR